MFDYFGGIDFSGAREPLSNLWTAVGSEQDGKLRIVSLRPHAFREDLRGYASEGWRAEQNAAEDDRILWGADFPFGVPAASVDRLVPGLAPEEAWAALLAWVADRSADEVRDALADRLRERRLTDTGGAMPPLELKLYRQTIEGLRWLHGLREAGEVSVVPQAATAEAATALIEVYPSASAQELGLPRRRAPGRPGEGRARAAALRTYVGFADPSLEAIATTLEDAWDATIACLTAWLCRDDLGQPYSRAELPRETIELEGWIFTPPGAAPRAPRGRNL